MKISSIGKNPDSFVVSGSEKLNKGETENTDFSKALSGAARKEYEKDLQLLMEEVDKRAKILAKSCTLKDLKNYKRAVKNFLKKTMGEAYEAQDQSSWDRFGRQKLYVLVKKVNENLEDLSRQLLNEQKDTLSILKKIDEIRGLLVDMYL
ncbi:MAG: YaaR family protein [Peptococcaceae bacterium]